MERYVKLSIVIFAILVWVVMAAFYQTTIAWINPDWDKMLLGRQFTVSDLLGLLTGVGVMLWLWFDTRVNQFGLEVAAELKKVTWPSWSETKTTTIVVIVVTLVVSLLLAFFDLIWGSVTSWIYRL